jgi:hypothetical protein
MKGLANHFSQALISLGFGRIDESINLFRIWLPVAQTVFTDICFDDFAYKQCVTAQIKGMDHSAFEIKGTFLDQRRRLEDTLKNFKNRRLVFLLPGIDPAEVYLLCHISESLNSLIP